MRRMEKITGRSDDMMILRGVNVFPTQIEEQILTIDGLAPHFQIELTREGRMDEMIVHVEVAAVDMAEEHRVAASRALSERIKAVVGVNVRVDVLPPESVARSQGKAVRIVDKRPKG
jgi:phenylacetate-CoA ligase